MDRKPPVLTITVEDIKHVKNAAFGHINRTWPKGLSSEDLQVLLICQGFISYMGQRGYTLPIEIDYEWEKYNRAK